MSAEEAEPRFMRRAIELARYAVQSGSGGPFGAVIVSHEGDSPRVIAEGYNRVVVDNDPTAHAEVVAIRRAGEQLGTFSLAGAELYTSCEPCPMCWAAALWARVDRIIYAGTREDAAQAGFDDSEFHRELALPAEQRVVPAIEFLRPEASAAFADWTAKNDRTAY